MGDEGRDDRRFRRVVASMVGAPILDGNSLDVLRNGVEIFPAMLDAIRSAERRVDMVTYVYWTGDIAEEFADALADRARAGVDVRLLVDAVGAMPMEERITDRLTDAGVDLRRFRPPSRLRLWENDNRTHRKVLVCDGRVAFTGGVGIAEQWEGDANDPSEWRDTHVRVTGPAVDGLHACFIADWQQTVEIVSPPSQLDDPPQPTGDVELAVVDDTPRHGRGPSGVLLHGLLEKARHRVRIATPYFNPTDAFSERIAKRVEEGVRVQLLVPGEHIDKRVSALTSRERLRPMRQAGVEVHTYERTMLHAKVLLVDDVVAVVGSININRRSMGRDAEVALVIFDTDIVAELDAHFDTDLDHAEPFDPPSRWSLAGIRDKVVDGLLAPINPQL